MKLQEYTERVERNLEGLEAVSTGVCPGCQECADTHTGGDLEGLEAGWSSGAIPDEPSFSWSSCGICDCHLGGDREVWHALSKSNPEWGILHFDDACADCVQYLANGPGNGFEESLV